MVYIGRKAMMMIMREKDNLVNTLTHNFVLGIHYDEETSIRTYINDLSRFHMVIRVHTRMSGPLTWGIMWVP